MAKKRKKISAEEAAFDERTKMINEYIEQRWKVIEERKAAEQQAEAQSG